MASKTEAYADTSAFIAFLDRSDSHHALYLRLFSNPPALVTSTLAIAEGHGWFLRRYDTRRAIEFLQFIRELPALTVISFGQPDLAVAAPMLSKFGDQRLTLADIHGLLLMKQRRIRTCWSTDRHLGLTGVALVV